MALQPPVSHSIHVPQTSMYQSHPCVPAIRVSQHKLWRMFLCHLSCWTAAYPPSRHLTLPVDIDRSHSKSLPSRQQIFRSDFWPEIAPEFLPRETCRTDHLNLNLKSIDWFISYFTFILSVITCLPWLDIDLYFQPLMSDLAFPPRPPCLYLLPCVCILVVTHCRNDY